MKINRTWFQILAYSGFTGLLGKAGQFLGLTCLALVLSSDDYGRFAIAQIVSTGFVSIVSSSFGMAASKKFSKTSSLDSKIVTGAAILTFRKHLLLAAPVAVLVVPLLYWKLSGESIPAWVIPWALLTICIVLVDIVSGSLAGSGAVRFAGLLDSSRFLAIGILGFSLGSLFGWVGAAFALVLFDLLLSLFFLTNAWKQRGRIQTDLEHGLSSDSNKTVSSGIISNGVTQLASWTLTWAIQTVFGLSAVGAYSVAGRFTSLILIVPGLLSRNSLGYLARQKNDKDSKSYLKAIFSYLTIIFLAVLTAALVVLIMVNSAFSSLFDQYVELPAILGVLFISMSVRALSTGLGVICVSWGMLRLWVWSDIFGAAASIVWVLVAIAGNEPIEIVILGSLLSAGIALFMRLFAVVKGALKLARS